VQEAAKESWDIIAELFEVRRQVTRFGVRTSITWRADTEQDIETALVGTGMIRETEAWRARIGVPVKRSFTGVEMKGDQRLRYQLAGGSVKIEGPVTENLKGFHAPHAIMLDVDRASGAVEEGVQAQPIALRGEDVKNRVREAWKHATGIAHEIGKAIAEWNGRPSS
jgi:hypothetical protein